MAGEMSDISRVVVAAEGPVVAVALHDGHRVRDELKPLLKVAEEVRRREEDPYTAAWTRIGDLQVAGTHSRFEVDLNRQRYEAVYLRPEDAWGIEVWHEPLPEAVYARSLREYDDFYADLYQRLKALEKAYGSFFVYDLHAYNHRRGGAGAPVDPVELNPEVNIGTGTMNRERWQPLVDGLMEDLRAFDFGGRSLDVRENVKFMGRGFPKFIHDYFPLSGCAVAIEFKKFWMDEWSGARDARLHGLIGEALESTVPKVRERLLQCG
jgi:N-formylglutamate deformylase